MEEFVLTALVPHKVDAQQKRDIADAIVALPRDQLAPGAVRMPTRLGPKPCLSKCVGPQSLHFFRALSISTEFLEEPVESWGQIPAYQKLESFVLNMPVTNGESERMIWRTVMYCNIGHKGEAELQGTLQTVGSAVSQVPNRDTKKALVAAYYKWLLIPLVSVKSCFNIYSY